MLSNLVLKIPILLPIKYILDKLFCKILFVLGFGCSDDYYTHSFTSSARQSIAILGHVCKKLVDQCLVDKVAPADKLQGLD